MQGLPEGSKASLLMKFLYNSYQVRLVRDEPLVTVWRPTTSVFLHGPLGTVRLNALVDCGADQRIFPMQFAEAMGITLDYDRVGSIKGVSGKPIEVYPADVELELTDLKASYRWSATVRFAPGNNVLLGHLGSLEFFTVNLDYHNRLFELSPNNAFPGLTV